jgi:hypothetical protein
MTATGLAKFSAVFLVLAYVIGVGTQLRVDPKIAMEDTARKSGVRVSDVTVYCNGMRDAIYRSQQALDRLSAVLNRLSQDKSDLGQKMAFETSTNIVKAGAQIKETHAAYESSCGTLP